MTCQSKSFYRVNNEMVCGECHTVHPQARTAPVSRPVHSCVRDNCTTVKKSKTSKAGDKVADIAEAIVDGICNAAAGIANGIGKMLD